MNQAESNGNQAQSLTSPLLRRAGFRHAFFTRRGGVSTGPFASLSFSVSAGDDPRAVEENLSRAARALGVEPDRIYFLSQVHGCKAWTAGAGDDRNELVRREGDALVSVDPRIACAVRTADCVPVLMADPQSGAVAAVHAGWRGVVAGVVESAVALLCEVAAARSDRAKRARGSGGLKTTKEGEGLLAAIGPHISLAAFEVSEDVARQLERASPDPTVVDRARWPKPHVDLGRLVRAKLVALGLGFEQVDDVRGCTVQSPDLFFSFRRDGARSGRHLSAIVPSGLDG